MSHTRAGRHVRYVVPPCAVAARPCRCLWRHRGVSTTAAMSDAYAEPPHVERGSGRQTGRSRHGRDTLPLDNPDHKRNNGW